MTIKFRKKLKKGSWKNRYDVLSVLFILVCIAIAAQLVNIQLIKGSQFNDQSQERLLSQRSIASPRGSILDRNGVVMASSKAIYNVSMTKSGLNSDQLNDMILKLISILEKNNISYSSSLNKYLTINPIAFGPSLENAKSLEKWKNEIAGVSAKKITSPETAFLYFRDKFKINPNYSDADAYKIMCIRYEVLIKGWSSINSVCIATDVNQETVAEIEDRSFELPGVTIDEIPQRRYFDQTYSAHVMGYVGSIGAEEYKKLKSDGYKFNDYIGKTGIEAAAETYLRGVAGRKKVKLDGTTGEIAEVIDTPVNPGYNVVSTIDTRIQKVAMESLQNNIALIRKNANYKNNFGDACAGAAIAMDVNTGEILAMASYPDFNPSIYLASAEDKEAQRIKREMLADNTNAPLLNRCIQGTYTPGSTYKPVTAIAGLEENVITPMTIIRDDGTINISGWQFYCLEYRTGHRSHGALTLEKALGASCNIYFHDLGVRTGIDKLDKWAKLLGLGEYTNVDIPGEEKGIRANKESKQKLRKDIWRPADTAQSAIGQFDNVFTPIQLVNYIATIANGGKRYTPYTIQKIVKSDGTVVKQTEPEYTNVNMSSETIAAIKKGMIAVVNSVDGTAVNAFYEFPFKVAGKTGTAETGAEAKHSSNSLFVCYAPAEKPEIAVCIVIERGAWGAYAAPVARDIMREYFANK